MEWTDRYNIYQWRIIWSSHRKLAWMWFEPTTNWVIRPWVQLALRANFLQLLQFHRLFSVAFRFNWNFNWNFLYIQIIYIYISINIYKYIYICMYLPVDVIVTLPYPWCGDSQGQETFLARQANQQLWHRVLKPPSLPINSKAKGIEPAKGISTLLKSVIPLRLNKQGLYKQG